MPGDWRMSEFTKQLDVIRSNFESVWVHKYHFQQHVLEVAWHKLKKRGKGWITHHGADTSENNFQTAWEGFEKKHFAAYRRWRKLSHASGGFQTKTSPSLESSIQKIFLFYVVYGELNDFRSLKNVLSLFFHVAVTKYQDGKGTDKIADWIRAEGTKLYRLIATVYSKEEMNEQCFHHDDLDDLATTSSFVKKFLQNGNDFFKAFQVDTPNKFPAIHKLVSLDTPTFIPYWLKGNQDELYRSEEKRRGREKWILENFVKDAKDKEEVRKLEDAANKNRTQAEEANQVQRDESENWNSAERYRPKDEDFEDKPDAAAIFRSAVTQLETARELLKASEDMEAKVASVKLKEAKVKFFNNRKDSELAYKDAAAKYFQLQSDFAECTLGFQRAYEGFTDRTIASECKSFAAEAKFLKAKAHWKSLNVEEVRSRIESSRILQFAYEDSINKERAAFAKKWKTYFEKAGGTLGITGYWTVFYHYSQVVYLHLFLMLPMGWLLFDYHEKIDTSDFGASIQNLVSMDTLFKVEENALIMLAYPIALILILWVIFNTVIRFRLRGAVSAPRRDAGIKTNWHIQGRWACFWVWVLTILTECVVMKLLVLNPIKAASDEFTGDDGAEKDYVKLIILLVVLWVPSLVLFFSSIQFIFSYWIGVFGFFYGLRDGVCSVRTWSGVIASFEKTSSDAKGSDGKPVKIPKIVFTFYKTMFPKADKGKELSDQRKYVAFAKVWNCIISYFYEIHKISKEEHQRLSFKIKVREQDNPSTDFLAGEVEKDPDMKVQPNVKDVRYHIIRFVNNIKMDKPTKHIAIKEMLPLCIVTPVGAEKILYPYDFITHVDNTQSSFLQHLIDKEPAEWENFKKKECLSDKAKDWVDRMEKDVLQGAIYEKKGKKMKRWIDSTEEGQNLKMKVCEWASLRFQALYRTVHGFMQVPKALALLARLQDPALSQEKAEELAHEKFSYVVGYQTYSSYYKKYKATKDKGKRGEALEKDETEAHEAVYYIKFIRKKFPEIKIAYPDTRIDPNTNTIAYIGRMVSGVKQTKGTSRLDDYTVELFGPFGDMGLGKPTHQTYLSQFIDGLVIQTIDVNQDNVISQSFFVPNLIAEFDRDSRVKIIGCPEFVITTKWSATAWCSAFSEHTFGTLVQRCYARLGIRLHYGHPDYMDALWVMTETGLSKMSYVSEDIFTGFDTVIKGGRVIHVEYHEVGKARDVDLYTTTKFQRKISMGASQMACSRYINQLQTCWSVSYFQALSYYYSTVGFYLNHLMLYMSVWFALVSQVLLIILQKFVWGESIANFITERLFTFQIGFALIAPGVLQLILEYGVIGGLWQYLSRFFILAVYSTFHILNISSYWQWGLTNSAYYLASGRGTGLEHYFMKDMYDTFYRTHWGPGFIIFWIGILALILSSNILVFLVMYLLPSGIWLWGAMFLNPGSLPSTVHEEQWKRLMNRDMAQARQIVNEHAKVGLYEPPVTGNGFSRFFKNIGRSIRKFFRLLHWIYTGVNFAIHMRVTRFIAVIAIFWEWVFSERIPTFIFTDERRRILRWDEDDTRQKSIFFSSMVRTDSADNVNMQRVSGKPLPTLPSRDPGSSKGGSSDDRPLPPPPNKPKPKPKRNRSVRFLGGSDSQPGSGGNNNNDGMTFKQ